MDSDFYELTTSVVPRTFEEAARQLLGVEDPTAKVVSYTEHDESNHDSTFESWDTVTVECAGRTLTLEGSDCLPRLLRRLEFVGHEKPRDTIMRILNRAEPVLPYEADYLLFTDRDSRPHTVRSPLLGGGVVTVLLVTSLNGQPANRQVTFNLPEVTHITEVS